MGMYINKYNNDLETKEMLTSFNIYLESWWTLCITLDIINKLIYTYSKEEFFIFYYLVSHNIMDKYTIHKIHISKTILPSKNNQK